jgi:myo-inositol 2-dehydrogenase/D-chiro-inositol 1-dehydrogenase/scyllo-inositol 2-dehydrogenase (NAD+)
MYDLEKSNGIIAEVNSHDIDSLLWFTGSAIARVYAEAHNFKCPEAREDYPEFYDNVVACFRFTSGAIGTVDGTCPAGYGYDARLEVLCEKGVIFVGSAQEHGVTTITAEGHVQGEAVRSWRSLFREAYEAELAHFVGCILEDREPRVTGRDGLRAVEAVIAVNQSIRTGQPVLLGQEAPA